MLPFFLPYCKSNQVPEAFVYLNLVPGLLEHTPNIMQIYHTLLEHIFIMSASSRIFALYLLYCVSHVFWNHIEHSRLRKSIVLLHAFSINTRSIDSIFEFLPLCKRLVQSVSVFEIMLVATTAWKWMSETEINTKAVYSISGGNRNIDITMWITRNTTTRLSNSIEARTESRAASQRKENHQY